MKKITNILLIATIVNLSYLLLLYSFNPYRQLPFMNLKSSYDLPVIYLPSVFCLLSLIMFFLVLFKTKTKNWFYFFIISLNLIAHIGASYYYAKASDWIF